MALRVVQWATGSVGVAAVGVGRSFMGNDLCAEAVTIARDRMIDAGADTAEQLATSSAGQLGLQM